MNIDCFMKRFPDILMNDQNDHVFETIKTLVGGTTSSRISKLINFAVSQIDDSECYVEVGVFTGATLCSANHNNYKTCIGIDKYDSYEVGKMTSLDESKIRDRCLYNIQCLCRSSTLIEKDFRIVEKNEIPKPVAVSFIDGTHTKQEVMDNLFWLNSFLADRAIIIFDDVNYMDVTHAMSEWLMMHGENYDLVAYVKPYYQDERYVSSVTDRFLNNGVAIIHYHKDPKEHCMILPEKRPLKGEN